MDHKRILLLLVLCISLPPMHAFAEFTDELLKQLKNSEAKAATYPSFSEINWLGISISEPQWEFIRSIKFGVSSVRAVTKKNSTLEVMDYTTRKSLNESAAKYLLEGEVSMNQLILPHTKEDVKLINIAEKVITHEVAQASVYLKDGSVIHSKIVHGDFSNVDAIEVFKDLKRKIIKKGIRNKDIIEGLFNHTHPGFEYLNISKNLTADSRRTNHYFLAPITSNDFLYSGDEFYKLFGDKPLTIRASLFNGYTYHMSVDKEGYDTSREDIWKSAKLPMPSYNFAKTTKPYKNSSKKTSEHSTKSLIEKYLAIRVNPKTSKAQSIEMGLLEVELERRYVSLEKVNSLITKSCRSIFRATRGK